MGNSVFYRCVVSRIPSELYTPCSGVWCRADVKSSHSVRNRVCHANLRLLFNITGLMKLYCCSWPVYPSISAGQGKGPRTSGYSDLQKLWMLWSCRRLAKSCRRLAKRSPVSQTQFHANAPAVDTHVHSTDTHTYMYAYTYVQELMHAKTHIHV